MLFNDPFRNDDRCDNFGNANSFDVNDGECNAKLLLKLALVAIELTEKRRDILFLIKPKTKTKKRICTLLIKNNTKK